MEELAGMMGMSETEFYQTTPRYFHNRLTGWRNNIQREENWHKWHLHLHRRFGSMLFNLQIDKMSRKDEKEYFPFPWDEKPKTVSKEELMQWVKDTGNMEIPIDQF